MHVDHSIKTNQEHKNLKKQEILDIFIKTNKIKLIFKMMLLMEVSKICLEEQLLIKYYVI